MNKSSSDKTINKSSSDKTINKSSSDKDSKIIKIKKTRKRIKSPKRDCIKEEFDFNNSKEETNRLKIIFNKCNKENYDPIVKNPITLKGLLEFIKERDNNDVRDLLNIFPHPGSGERVSNTDSHVFEALWVLIFLFKYDDLRDSNQERVFYKTLERGEKDERNVIKIVEETNVNESSGSGIADIFFEHKDKKTSKDNEEKIKKENCGNGKMVGIPSCENETVVDKNKKFLFSAKYFKKEKGLPKYDISDILTEAQKLLNFNIILLVNDKKDIERKIDTSRKAISDKVYKTFGLNDLDIYYKRLKSDLQNISVEEFINKNHKKRDKTYLEPRFHQQYFIDYSYNQIKKNNFKIIWGAVPRSGKSFMIGGMVSKMKPKQVVIFLGAVSETNQQFFEMFDQYDDFKKYEIINIQKEGSYKKIDINKQNIILISQQKAWGNNEDEELLELLKEKDKIIFFDEIHQGSSVGNSQEKLLDRYVFNTNKLENPFIMVTATFTKPLIRYMNRGGVKAKLIQWGYEDIQMMKEISDPISLNEILDKIKDDTDGELKYNIFNNIIENYKKNKTLKHLEEEYEKYPELVCVVPELENINKDKIKFKNLFVKEKKSIDKDTICNTIFKCNTNQKFPERDGFKNEVATKEFLYFIINNIYNKILNSRFSFNVFEKIHTQLWFLPTICSNSKKILNQNNTKETNTIEPIGRLLAKLLMDIPEFKKHFCILVINSQKLPDLELYPDIQNADGGKIIKYNKLKVTSYSGDVEPCISTRCINYKDSGGISGCIMREEACAKNKNKSLIILTGMRLRLGISLPCVDIALHMDPIQSVDIIYQSMFRVLTERKGKKQGFFVDLLSERFINFIYEYDSYMNKGTKNIDIQSKRKQIIEKLYSFNLNGVDSKIVSNTEMISINSSIMDKLSLKDNETFSEKIESIQTKELFTILDNINNPRLLEKLYNDLKDLKMSSVGKNTKTKTKIELKLLKRDKSNDEYKDTSDSDQESDNEVPKEQPEPREEEKTKKETEKDKEKKYNSIINYIKDIFAMSILFESELFKNTEIKSDCGKENIIKLIEKLEYQLTVGDIKNICNDDKNQHIIDCHISYLKGIDLNTTNQEQLQNNVEDLNKYRNLIVNFLKQIDNNSEFINFYCIIRDKFRLMEKSLKNGELKYSPQCKDKKLIDSTKDSTKDYQGSMEGGGGQELIDNNVLEIIREHLVIRDTEKKLFGEVFTPVELICDMLGNMPVEVWKNPNLKWLDPANGIGNFPIVVYYKLMSSLKNVIKDDKKRSKHIIENMLYMVELNPINCKVCKKIFKMIDSDSTPNIYNKDFLEWSDKHREKYDVIMGNPPYQKKVGPTKTQHIWDRFVINSITKCLKENGFLVFIHPNSWRNIDGNFKGVFNLIQERELQKLNMRGFKDGAKMFSGSGTNYDYYCLKNTLTKTNRTKIDDIDKKYSELDLNSYDFIPSGKFDIFEKIIKDREKVNIVDIVYSSSIYEIRNDYMSKEKSTKFKYPCVYTITTNKGIKLWYSNVKNGMFGIPKVIWSNGLGTYPIIDKIGEYGLTQFSYGIKDDPHNLHFIQNALNDPEFIELMEYVKFTNNKYNYKIIGAFKKDFWKEFNYKSLSKSPSSSSKKSSTKSPNKKTKKKSSCNSKKKTKCISKPECNYVSPKDRKEYCRSSKNILKKTLKIPPRPTRAPPPIPNINMKTTLKKNNKSSSSKS